MKTFNPFLNLPILFIVAIMIPGPIFGQNIEYGYDASGNRISRQFIVLSNDSIPGKESSWNNRNVLSDNIADIPILLYPNPTKGELFINIESLPENKTIWLELYSLSEGKLIQALTLKKENLLDLSPYRKGTYILIIRDIQVMRSWRIIRI